MPPNLRFYDLKPHPQNLRQAVAAGLSGPHKSLPPKFFYDETGSRLFEEICATPEYYPTRTELGLLERHAGEIAEALGPRCRLVEPGSGSSRKVRTLLERLRPLVYEPLDISGAYLLQASTMLAEDYPWLAVHAVCVDFVEAPLPTLDHAPAPSSCAIFFPGSSIGNFEPNQARFFLRRLAAVLGSGNSLLIGYDLKKETALLEAAYNDAAGLTAAFNLNLLARINRELQADFGLDAFHHHAFYNEREGRVEMHLVSRRRQQVRLDGLAFEFEAGETIHTENSYKYQPDEFAALARQAGFTAVGTWTDERQWFALQHYVIAS